MAAPSRFRVFPLWLAAVEVAAGYYVGVQIGLALTFPGATTSVLWPPNAILTTALLLVPVRRWWVCFAAALPVHLAVELGAGMSPGLVGALFLTNCSEAAIAAGGMRLLSDAPTEFNTFRRVLVFLGCAVVAAPILSSIADAAVVHFFRGEPYWTVVRTRSFGNALTELSVVPCAVRGLLAIRNGLPLPAFRRVLEAGVLALGMAGVAAWAFSGGMQLAGIPRTTPILLLPLLWAAARFGVSGVSAALFLAALLASYEARTTQPAIQMSPLEGLIEVQMYLIVIGVPLMCMAALLDERRRASIDLAHRLKFEALLSTVSQDFVRTPSGMEPAELDGCLRRVGEFLDVDQVGLLRIGEGATGLEPAREWTHPRAQVLLAGCCVEKFPWASGRVLAGETLVCHSIESLPRDAQQDRESFRQFDLQSAVVLPLAAGGRILGAMSVAALTPRVWTERELMQLELVAEVLSNDAARRQAEVEVQRTRQELAHLARLSSMGELTASLAHQLSQPLTGILNNTQAAARFIDSGRATIPGLRDIITDIEEDDRRASDVLRRVRDMVARTEWSPVPIDANTLVRDVGVLVASDALLRNVSVALDVAPEPLTVIGNRIDLEQVLLNVVTNAMDAVADRPDAQRMVTVKTRRDGNGLVQIVVRDRGAGLPAGAEDQIFEPFVTTKPTGMGMGLAVARSLIDDHGGKIWAANHPSGGAVVTISFPIASDHAGASST
jgi:signal transduction histidine kinase/integral membrane sensor domain MASE1